MWGVDGLLFGGKKTVDTRERPLKMKRKEDKDTACIGLPELLYNSLKSFDVLSDKIVPTTN